MEVKQETPTAEIERCEFNCNKVSLNWILYLRFRCQQRIEESNSVSLPGSDKTRSKCTAALQLRSVRHPALLGEMVPRHLRVLQIHAVRASGRKNFLLQHRNQSWCKRSEKLFYLAPRLACGIWNLWWAAIRRAKKISDDNWMRLECKLWTLCESALEISRTM